MQAQPKSLSPPRVKKGELALTPARTDTQTDRQTAAPPQLFRLSPRTRERSQADLSVYLEHQCLPKQIARKAPQIAGGLVNWRKAENHRAKHTQAAPEAGKSTAEGIWPPQGHVCPPSIVFSVPAPLSTTFSAYANRTILPQLHGNQRQITFLLFTFSVLN